MNINIDYQSRTPIYEQIVKAIENMVAIGVLKPNEQISSIRELAISLSINPNTVKKAYDILENKNIIVSKSNFRNIKKVAKNYFFSLEYLHWIGQFSHKGFLLLQI